MLRQEEVAMLALTLLTLTVYATTVSPQTFDNFYHVVQSPALTRGSAPERRNPSPALRRSLNLVLPRGRFKQPWTTQRTLAAKSPNNWQGTDHVTNKEFPLISLRDKRLMGIFRCYGWGPGCSETSYLTSPRSASMAVDFSPQTKSRENQSRRIIVTSSNSDYSSKVPVITDQRSSQRSHKFEPFFTLTSGGSWGPTGKRGSSKKYSASEKRIDFLKQILRDMLDDFDEEEFSTSLVARSRTTKRDSNIETDNIEYS